MPRIVLDTSVIVSALLKKDGVSRKALSKAAKGTLILSSETLTELSEVLNRPKFERFFSEEEKLATLNLLIEQGEAIVVSSSITICRDLSDNKFLNLAVDGKADVIVSRDPDLLILSSVNGIPILTPAAFLSF